MRAFTLAAVIAISAIGLSACDPGPGVKVQGLIVCNGTTLPTCAIVKRESGFNPRAENPHSTASGLYQFIDRTWRSCGTRYSHASHAPVSTQVGCARKVWNGGHGASHWRL